MTAAASAPPATMHAIVRERYGSPDVLELRSVPVPELTDEGVLVRVRASSVNPVDWHELRGEPWLVRTQAGLRRPKDGRMGTDLAGVVEAIGAGVTGLAVGDAVMGVATGSFAEVALARARNLVRMPEAITFEAAAALPVAGTTALQALRDHGRVQAGQRVLIVGASGGVGHLAVQLARASGAEVTGVARRSNLDLVRSLGAHHVIDHELEDFTAAGPRFDVIVDMAGTRPVRACRRALTPTGTYVVVGGPSGRWIRPMERMIAARLLSLRGTRRSVAFLARIDADDLKELAILAADGRLAPVIERTWPLAAAAEAVRYQELGHTRGKVSITI